MYAQTVSIVHEDAHQAGRQTAAELLAQMGRPPDVVLAFVTSRHAPERALEGLWSLLPARTRLLGCSSFAEIGTEGAVAGSVTAMGIAFERVEWATFKLEHHEADGSSTTAGRRLGERIAGFHPKLVILLPDGVTINSTKLVRALQQALGPQCPVVGGVASEGLRLERTFELFDREVLEGGVVALALRGPVTLATSARAGFQPVGVTRTCTRVEDDELILELDGESALGLYKGLLGPDVAGRPNIGTEFPLAIIEGTGGDYMASDERSQVIRRVRRLDEARGALLCSDVYEGARVRMTRATKRDLVAAATSAAVRARHALPNAKLGLCFDCAGRRLVLGGRYQEEIRSAFAALDPELPKIGFYTYGEIAPVDGTNMVHDETFTLALVGTT
jgi:hypothetical protein